MAVGAGPNALIATDFDGDTYVDLAVSNSGDESVVVLRGDGTGGFVLADRLEPGARVLALASADFDMDGNSDLALAKLQTGSIAVWRGSGDVGFSLLSEQVTGTQPSFVSAADFDGDGDPDLAVVDQVEDVVVLLRNDGSGAFVAGSRIPAGPRPLSLASGDLDLDGDIDLAIGTVLFGRQTRTFVLHNDGSGQFVKARILPVGGVGTAIGEFNATPGPDLAVLVDSLLVFVSDGAGDYVATRVSLPVRARSPLGTGDVDGDGVTDLVVAHQLEDSVGVFLNQLVDRADVNASNRIDGFDVAILNRPLRSAMGRTRTTCAGST